MKFWRLLLIFFGLALVLGGASNLTLAQGNSEAAHRCQDGGYANLIGTNGETFANTGQCVRFIAQGGTFAEEEVLPQGTIVVPTGRTVTLQNAVFSADHALTYGYSINGADVQLASKPEERWTNVAVEGTTIGPFDTAVVLHVYMTDDSCGGVRYDSDGNHAIVSANPPVYEVDIADAGLECDRQTSPVSGFAQGNLSVQVVINS